MRIYVAAPWTRKVDAALAAAQLERAGHTITKKWWEHREVPGYLDPSISETNCDELITQAREDLAGVQDAEAFVLLNLEKSEGKAVETGFAFAAFPGPEFWFLYGGKSNLFHYLPIWAEVTSMQEVVEALAGVTA